jgi:hypothetical protein
MGRGLAAEAVSIAGPKPTPRRSPEPMEERGKAHFARSAETPGNQRCAPRRQIASTHGGPHRVRLRQREDAP